jgi:hypothetical protein
MSGFVVRLRVCINRSGLRGPSLGSRSRGPWNSGIAERSRTNCLCPICCSSEAPYRGDTALTPSEATYVTNVRGECVWSAGRITLGVVPFAAPRACQDRAPHNIQLTYRVQNAADLSLYSDAPGESLFRAVTTRRCVCLKADLTAARWSALLEGRRMATHG